MVMRACRVEGCDRSRYARELCKPHYSRFLDHGDPETGKPVRPGRVRPCSVDGCERPYKGRGYCETHLVQVRKFGRTWQERKPPEPGAGRPRAARVGYGRAHSRLRELKTGRCSTEGCLDRGVTVMALIPGRGDLVEQRPDRRRVYSLNPGDYRELCLGCAARQRSAAGWVNRIVSLCEKEGV